MRSVAFRVYFVLPQISNLYLKSYQGFTLIELMVTVAIVSLLIGTGIPAFRRFGRVQQLNLGADQVKAALLDTRALALSPRSEKDAQPPPAIDADCPSIIDTASASINQYAIVFLPENGTLSASYKTCEGRAAISTGQLPTMVNVVGTPPPIIFSISKQGKVIAPATQPIITVMQDQIGPTTTRTISINRETGAVSIQ